MHYGVIVATVKHLVQNKATRAYLTGDGKWEYDYRLAQDFNNMQAAMHACLRHRIADADLLLMIGDRPSQTYDVALPLFVRSPLGLQ